MEKQEYVQGTKTSAEEEVVTLKKERLRSSCKIGKLELELKDLDQVDNGRKKKSLYKGTEHEKS